MNKGIIHDALVLFAITLIAGFALGAVHEVTLAPIQASKKAAATKTYQEVFADASSFGDAVVVSDSDSAAAVAGNDFGKVTVNDYMEALDASGAKIGYVVSATSGDGYKGPIQVAVGINNDGQITGIGFLTIDETPGLGMKAKDPEFKDQFAGKDAQFFELSKTGASADNQINCISGATFSSKATMNAVNAAVAFSKTLAK